MRKILLLFILAVCGITALSAQENTAMLYGVSVDNKIVKINPVTGEIINSISLNTDPNYEEGLAVSGKYLFYINGRVDAVGINKIIVIDTSLTEIIDTLEVDFPPRIDGLAINGDLLYVLDFVNNEMLVLNLLTNTIDTTLSFSFPAIGGICYAGNRESIFISSFDLGTLSDNKIYEINPETAEVINSFDVSYSPFGLAYSNSKNLLFASTGSFMGEPTIAVDPDNGEEMYSFTGAYSALAGDESLVEINANFLKGNTVSTENIKLNNVSLYPSPTNGAFTLDLKLEYANIDVVIKDISGKEIYAQNFKNKHKMTIQFEGSPGMYFVEIHSDELNGTFKVLKQ